LIEQAKRQVLEASLIEQAKRQVLEASLN